MESFISSLPQLPTQILSEARQIPDLSSFSGLWDLLQQNLIDMQNHNNTPLHTKEVEESFVAQFKQSFNLQQEYIPNIQTVFNKHAKQIANGTLESVISAFANNATEIQQAVSAANNLADLKREIEDLTNQAAEASQELQNIQSQIEAGDLAQEALASKEAEAQKKINLLEDFVQSISNKIVEVLGLKDIIEKAKAVLEMVLEVVETAIDILQKLIIVTIVAIIGLTIASAWTCGIAASLLPALKATLKVLQDAMQILQKVRTGLHLVLRASITDILKLVADHIGLTDTFKNKMDELKITEKLAAALKIEEAILTAKNTALEAQAALKDLNISKLADSLKQSANNYNRAMQQSNAQANKNQQKSAYY